MIIDSLMESTVKRENIRLYDGVGVTVFKFSLDLGIFRRNYPHCFLHSLHYCSPTPPKTCHSICLASHVSLDGLESYVLCRASTLLGNFPNGWVGKRRKLHQTTVHRAWWNEPTHAGPYPRAISHRPQVISRWIWNYPNQRRICYCASAHVALK